MVRNTQNVKGRWLLLLVLSLASIVFTGCEKGSLGVKGGSAVGYVLNSETNQPIPEVLVKAEGGGEAKQTMTTYTGGDGSYSFHDMAKGDDWKFYVEKYGYYVSGTNENNGTATANLEAAAASINNGETINLSVIKMTKAPELYKGTLKGYPVDSITGRPLRNFTVTQTEPYNQRKSKLFETAEDFRTLGWTGLEGGDHHYTITCNNYVEYKTNADPTAAKISIGASAVDLGTIKVQPLTVNIAGTLRNLPGYVLDTQQKDILIWAESAGKVVATFTDPAVTDAYKGSVNYLLTDIPVTAGSVSIKCKIRGYDLLTINSAVSIPTNIPGGTIGGIDADFSDIEPIRRDLRIVVTGTMPDDSTPSSFPGGDIARIYIRQGGKDIVPYVDVVSVNYRAEGYISGVITGYPIKVLVVNMSHGYYKIETDDIIVQEDGNTAYTINVTPQ